MRVTGLARALAASGFAVDLYFVGDPDLPGVEERDGVTLHRWCQAISAGARAGVYAAEEQKIEDFCVWLPDHMADVVAAEAAAGRRTVILAEDWHTAWPLIAVHEELVRRGLRSHAVLGWTANNRFGFDRIDFKRLAGAAALFTISRAMKHLMWQYGVNPFVVPNGIPERWLEPVPVTGRTDLRRAFRGQLLLAKVGRWDPDKRWHLAVEAVARLRSQGRPAVLVARGWNGDEAATSHYRSLRTLAANLGLEWATWQENLAHDRDLVASLRTSTGPETAIIELAAPIADRQLRILYGAADCVLANSGFEPFGLVGLEAMASRGIVITGSTGEDYIVPFANGFALDTDDPAEIVQCLDWLAARPEREAAMRTAAYVAASEYRWSPVTERLLRTLSLAVNR